MEHEPARKAPAMVRDWLAAYRAGGSRALSPEQQTLVAGALEALVTAVPQPREKAPKQAFSPFIYPH